MSRKHFRRPRPTPARAPNRRTRGFTLIEVMVAVGIMTVGAVAIMAMQQASTRGNRYSRQLTTANQVTRTWLERIRRDSLRWNTQGVAGLQAAGGPVYLSAAPPLGTQGLWFTPAPPVGSGESYGFDFFGNDAAGAGDMVYCTHMRLSWVIPNESIRADVRTFWHRRGRGTGDGISDLRLFANCASGSEDTVTAELSAATSRIHSIQASTVVRWQPLALPGGL